MQQMWTERSRSVQVPDRKDGNSTRVNHLDQPSSSGAEQPTLSDKLTSSSVYVIKKRSLFMKVRTLENKDQSFFALIDTRSSDGFFSKFDLLDGFHQIGVHRTTQNTLSLRRR
ncbi:uncharacterized protein LOC113004950 [Solenopsis invicta]|uniref:uncharacterized protein LOC113004950 n=1 Tax=Solenopsis invicta TaxID=13686 RepID=UPI000E340441|nr:uncharacterized protein LOC113004950 [Solenopsis invicta]